MGNEPVVEIVAKQRSSVTDALVDRIAQNFAAYHPLGDQHEFPLVESPHWFYHKAVVFNFAIGFDGRAPERMWKTVAGETVPQEFATLDFQTYVTYLSRSIFASVYADWGFEQSARSISPDFPFEVARFGMDYKGNTAEETARAGAILPMRLIDFAALGLTSAQQDEFRIVPYWEGPAKVAQNHLTHDQFRGLGMEGITRAFLFANEHCR